MLTPTPARSGLIRDAIAALALVAALALNALWLDAVALARLISGS